jgi:protein subunit release factor A
MFRRISTNTNTNATTREIRTYDYLQKTLTDHRTGLTTHLDKPKRKMLDGKSLNKVIEACKNKHREETIKELLKGVDYDRG